MEATNRGAVGPYLMTLRLRAEDHREKREREGGGVEGGDRVVVVVVGGLYGNKKKVLLKTSELSTKVNPFIVILTVYSQMISLRATHESHLIKCG